MRRGIHILQILRFNCRIFKMTTAIQDSANQPKMPSKWLGSVGGLKKAADLATISP